jgi:hypothetical protein
MALHMIDRPAAHRHAKGKSSKRRGSACTHAPCAHLLAPTPTHRVPERRLSRSPLQDPVAAPTGARPARAPADPGEGRPRGVAGAGVAHGTVKAHG